MTGFMRKWHKYLGLVTTVLVMLVSITGILLIHKKELGLNKVMLELPGYAKNLPPDAWDMVTTREGKTVLSSKQGVFVGTGDDWRRTLASPAKKLYAAGGRIYACAPSGLHLSSDGGETWNNLLPGEEAKALQISAGIVTVATARGIYRSGPTGKWETVAPLPGKGIDVRQLLPTAEGLLLAAKEGLYRIEGGKVEALKLPQGEPAATGVELQKVITDLHTGAFFGSWFMYVVDLVALSLVFFSLSGVWLWYVPWRKRQSMKVLQ